MKYIVYEENHLEIPVIFPSFVEHDKIMAEKKIVSAGFVSFHIHNEKREFYCYGKSVSLKKECRGDIDGDLIEKCYNFN